MSSIMFIGGPSDGKVIRDLEEDIDGYTQQWFVDHSHQRLFYVFDGLHHMTALKLMGEADEKIGEVEL